MKVLILLILCSCASKPDNKETNEFNDEDLETLLNEIDKPKRKT